MEYVEKLNSSHVFTTIVKNLDYETVGLQIVNNEDVIGEFTSCNKDGKIIKVEEGLKDPELVVKIDEDTVKDLLSKKEQAWIEKHPIEATMKYAFKIDMPLLAKLKLLKVLKEL